MSASLIIMHELLTREGYRVTTFTSAAEALALAFYAQDPSSFDLVLSDSIEKMLEQPEVDVHLHERRRRRAGICGR